MADADSPVQPKARQGDIPPELSFEEVVKNQSAPVSRRPNSSSHWNETDFYQPCSLNDFMDYLLYVERNAESLQFFLWYWDYVQRWSTLLPRQKALSPPWNPDQSVDPPSRFVKYSHRRERSQKMNKILAIMELDSERAATEAGNVSPLPLSPPPLRSPTTPASVSTLSISSILSPTEPNRPADWQPCTSLLLPVFYSIKHHHPNPRPLSTSLYLKTKKKKNTQLTSIIPPKKVTIPPNSSELTRITRHYLCPTSPRFLRLLPARDRATCLVASQHTTHPSALLPAFSAVEASLRKRSHPAFARWSLRNAGTARLHLVRWIAGLVVGVGVVVDVVLVLSRLPAYWRVVCLGLWWPAMVALWAAGSGVCVVLWWRGGRQVRPWETGEGSVEERKGVLGDEEDVTEVKGGGGDDDGGGRAEGWREHRRSETEVSWWSSKGRLNRGSSVSDVGKIRTSRTTTLTATTTKPTPSQYKPSLQVFGPRNDFSHEPWVTAYQAQGFWAKAVRQKTVAIHNRALLAWQDRVVFVSVLWGGAVATAVTVASLFVPVGGLF
ncbi:hypothetical protein VTJ49DRAFT_2529 [Mycothermus thermophilus]|uniref:RGS domain-containing protein n=1 Tax=Humicola insolens TaxID=85995 RepID=A0ABR3V9Q5_HUMIN